MENNSPPRKPYVHFSQELADEICELIIEGWSLRSICRLHNMPSISSVMSWVDKNETFQEQYARAMHLRPDVFFEEIQEIADDATNDFVERTRKDGSKEILFDKEHVMRSKLRIETRQFMMARMKPKKYGSSSILNQQLLDENGNPTNPQTTVLSTSCESMDKALAEIKRLTESEDGKTSE